MSRSWVITLLTLYALSILIYIIHSLRKKTKQVLLPVVVLLPLVGPVAVMIIAIGSAFGKEKTDVFEDMEDKREKFEYLTQINDEKEINIVPMKEAMALNKTSTQRDIVFELAKGNPTEYIKNLKQALLSEDSEVAHYAAASISKFKRELDKTLALREAEFSDRPDVPKNRNALIKILDEMIRAELVPDGEISKLRARIIEILMMEIRLGDVVGKELYHMICSYMLKQEDYENFGKWLNEFAERFPDADEPLRLRLQFAYRTKNKAMFQQVLSETETANYAITKETLNMINFWSQRKL